MKKLANFVVEKRNIIFGIFIVLAALSLFLMTKVDVNYNLASYLSSESSVSKGLVVMEEEFGSNEIVKVMVNDIKEEELDLAYSKLSSLVDVDFITFSKEDTNYYHNNKALFVITTKGGNFNVDTDKLMEDIRVSLSDYEVYISGNAVNNNIMKDTLNDEMPVIIAIAVALVIIVILLTSSSWIEPVLFLTTIGVAILLNMGTNIIFDDVSFVTKSIASILQLALSMDYSIMLIHRYQHEKKSIKDKKAAMKAALVNSFAAISSSSVTTIVGLLALVFMSFRIGSDIGLVLAKGVLFSLICVFFILPNLVLLFDRYIEKTKKKALSFNMKKIGNFCYKIRIYIAIVFIILCGVAFYFQRDTKIKYSQAFTNNDNDIIVENFGEANQFVVLYRVQDSNEKAKELITYLLNYKVDGEKVVSSIVDYSNTIGIDLTVEQMVMKSGINKSLISNLYAMYFSGNNIKPISTISLDKFIDFVITNVIPNEQYKPYFNEQTVAILNSTKEVINKNSKMLSTDNYHRMIINTDLRIEADDTFLFVEEVNEKIDKIFGDSNYILGDSVVSYEMKSSYTSEMNLITVITIVSIFIVVAITFKSLIIPLLLVSVIQCAVYASMAYTALADISLFFLALIIVQCIQMGATIDYAILLTSNYKEEREKKSISESVSNDLMHSMPTIFTSSVILILATIVVSIMSSQALLSEVCSTIARGALASTLLVIFVLPALISIFDKYIVKKK